MGVFESPLVAGRGFSNWVSIKGNEALWGWTFDESLQGFYPPGKTDSVILS